MAYIQTATNNNSLNKQPNNGKTMGTIINLDKLEDLMIGRIDNGYGLPFSNWDECDKYSFLKDLESGLLEHGTVTIRGKYIAVGCDWNCLINVLDVCH